MKLDFASPKFIISNNFSCFFRLFNVFSKGFRRAGAVHLAYDNIAIISCRDNEISTFVSWNSLFHEKIGWKVKFSALFWPKRPILGLIWAILDWNWPRYFSYDIRYFYFQKIRYKFQILSYRATPGDVWDEFHKEKTMFLWMDAWASFANNLEIQGLLKILGFGMDFCF